MQTQTIDNLMKKKRSKTQPRIQFYLDNKHVDAESEDDDITFSSWKFRYIFYMQESSIKFVKFL